MFWPERWQREFGRSGLPRGALMSDRRG